LCRGIISKFDRFQGTFKRFASDLMMGEKFDSLATMPGLSELPENERTQVLLAMIIQNATHQKNTDRI
jgi:hypothetical protein